MFRDFGSNVDSISTSGDSVLDTGSGEADKLGDWLQSYLWHKVFRHAQFPFYCSNIKDSSFSCLYRILII